MAPAARGAGPGGCTALNCSPPMARILVLFAHPRSDRSQVNIPLLNVARSVEGVAAVDLYAEYPAFDVDVDREQQRLIEHDVIVFQHPVYWYSSPAILKEWQDLVLEYGFAYGASGRALEGKILLNAVTCGARRDAYTRAGAYQHELRGLFAPFEQTARLCRMRFLPPFVLYAAGHAVEENRLQGHLTAYRRLLSALVEGTLDVRAARTADTLSDDLDRWIRPRSV